jgi:putative zinc finger/helix-turn-helix YgiT family protein
MFNDTNGQQGEKESCLECGSTKLVEQMREQQFAYGTAGKEALLTAYVPVISCEDCGFECFDERGEAARQAAVCRHLGVYTPDEIREIREATGLGRAEFCQVAGFGPASLQRWESGLIVPNASSDRLIFLLQYPENVERLRTRHINIPDQATTTRSSVAEESATIRDGVLEARTRHAVKKFTRLAHRPRVAYQAEKWNLRAR